MLDITHEKCPMTFVRTRLALDGMAAGRVLMVRLMGEEPHRNVRRSVLGLGHAVLAEQAAEDGSIVLTVQKKDPAPAG
ncbi:sulfurtransferase TusA family protein [Acetobacter persici]|uniref:sulfurtransferase TusA family protein n=1 Tax=Acetobacter persici TaxID=1076596 RepID=UPI0039E786A7